MKENNLKKYLDNIDQIKGWFNYENILDVYNKLNDLQQDSIGDLLEIGIFHGKGFIPLIGMTKPEEVCLGVDIFEDNLKEMKIYGCATINIVRNNISKVFDGVPLNTKLIKIDSQKLTSEDLMDLSTNKKFRFISVDGCHTYDCTLHDINISVESLTEDGVVVIDDYYNVSWPGVKAATDEYLNNNDNMQPIYIGHNKVILCPTNCAEKFYGHVRGFKNNKVEYIFNRHKAANMWKGIKNIYQ